MFLRHSATTYRLTCHYIAEDGILCRLFNDALSNYKLSKGLTMAEFERIWKDALVT
jgi:hypothetical protein